MDCTAGGGESGFAKSFAQGGMRLGIGAEAFAAGAEGNGHGGLVDQVARMGTQDVDAQDAVGEGVGEELDQAIGLAQGASAAAGAEWEDAFAVRIWNWCRARSA